ncbi:MAG: DUF3108 domain-containing protein [Muribaculum sp.]|nr:DUF3108 domain-containing protein [Muribaculum sp.]
MKHFICALLLIFCFAPSVMGVVLPNEDLEYIVLYKWGLINKDAASAVLSLRSDNGRYYAKMSARTLPWADKVFKVRDTLVSEMSKQDCQALMYNKRTHEGGRYENDKVIYERNGNRVTGYVTRIRQKNDGPVSKMDTVLHAVGPTVDMLSVFYYLRALDFPNMKKGQSIRLNVFSGKNVEELTIVYQGKATITSNRKKWRTCYLTFNFTRDGVPVSDDMSAWISDDDNRIPIKLEGKLPLGKVQAYYQGVAGSD